MSREASEQPARPKITLPSLKEVQAAQKARIAPNLFQTGAKDASAATSSSGTPRPNSRDKNAIEQEASHRSTNASQGGLAQDQGRLQQHSSNSGPVAPNRNATGPTSTSYPISYSCNSGLAMQRVMRKSRFNRLIEDSSAIEGDYKAVNASPNAVLVSKRQEGNPLLKHIRHVRWVYADIVPDYIMGTDTCALFLSMRFHLLKPDYIHHRIKELQRSFRLRVLMCHVDIDDVVEPLQQITRAALLNDVTLICGWSPEECARYLETFKVYETKPADAILGRTDEDYLSRLNAAFTTIRGVNKTDVLTLGSTFGTAARAMQASIEDLSACPGIGPMKVKRLHDAFHEPFRKTLQPQTAISPEAAPATVSGNDGIAVNANVSQQMPLDHAEDSEDDDFNDNDA